MQGWPHLKRNMMNEIFHFLIFREFIRELGKIFCQSWKMKFWTHWKICTYQQDFWPYKSFKCLIMKISTQVDNHKYKEKVLQLKKIPFKKMSLKFWNPKLNILGKIAFFFFIKCQPFGVQRSIKPFRNN